MPEKETVDRARRDAEQGKSPSTQAGEFVREEMEHIREGKHGAASPQQAIAIGLSKARRAGVKLPPPKRGRSSDKVRRQASRDLAKGRSSRSRRPSRKRSQGSLRGLLRKGSSAASRSALSRFAEGAARRRGAASRRRASAAAVRTKGRKGLRAAAQKAARTRRRRHAA
jgi:Family of unknown function (DUF6496)